MVVFFLSSKINAQIINDSVAQVVSYWEAKESHLYKVRQEKYKVKDKDTIYEYKSTCDLKITVVDSTETNYTVDWFYSNCKVESENPVYQKLSKVSNNMLLKFNTSEMGGFMELLNWESVRDTVYKSIDAIKEEYVNNDKQINLALEKIKAVYATKAGIQSIAMKDVMQFYHFHGGSYELNKAYSGKTSVSNSFGGSPFDASLKVSLDEIDMENDVIVLRSVTEVDSKQLTDYTYNYVKSTLPKDQQSSFPAISTLPQLTNITYISAVVHTPSGWPTYTIQEKEVFSSEELAVENTIIEFIE